MLAEIPSRPPSVVCSVCSAGVIMARLSYEEILETVEILPEWQKEADRVKAFFDKNFQRYKATSELTGVPPEVIAAIHQLEGSGNWKTHLANGDSLNARTVHKPKGLPKTGNPPFTWEQGAVAAIEYDELDQHNWEDDLVADLKKIELYNGPGYKKHSRNSLYMINGTQFAEPGKYVEDNVWDEEAESDQLGIIPILLVLGYIVYE